MSQALSYFAVASSAKCETRQENLIKKQNLTLNDKNHYSVTIYGLITFKT